MDRAARRTCVGCRAVRDQQALIRITADAAGNLRLNPRSAEGRGAYLCPSLACLAEAWRRKAFSRALRRDLRAPDETAVREGFEMELRRRGVAITSARSRGWAGGDTPGRLTAGKRCEGSAHPGAGEDDSAEARHRQRIRRPSGGWDGRR